MSPSWQFKALVEPTLKQWRVVYDRGRRQVQFFTAAPLVSDGDEIASVGTEVRQ